MPVPTLDDSKAVQPSAAVRATTSESSEMAACSRREGEGEGEGEGGEREREGGGGVRV